jgi:hypothetical protein
MFFQFWEERATSKIETHLPVTPHPSLPRPNPLRGVQGRRHDPWPRGNPMTRFGIPELLPEGRSEEPQATGSRFGVTGAAGAGPILDSRLHWNDG